MIINKNIFPYTKSYMPSQISVSLKNSVTTFSEFRPAGFKWNLNK
jgi:hypothetical protein